MTTETTEQRPPESNQEQFQRWVNYVETDLWPKIEELKTRCGVLYDSVSLEQPNDLSSLNRQYSDIMAYTDGIIAEVERMGRSFINQELRRCVLGLGHYIKPYVDTVRGRLDSIRPDVTMKFDSYQNALSRKPSYNLATKQSLIEKIQESLGIAEV